PARLAWGAPPGRVAGRGAVGRGPRPGSAGDWPRPPRRRGGRGSLAPRNAMPREASMASVRLSIEEGIAEVRLERGKVNALNEQVVDELAGCFRELANDAQVRGILLTG